MEILKIRKIGIVMSEMGLNPIRFLKALLGMPIYLKNMIKIILENRVNSRWKVNLFPVFADRYEQSGVARSQYFYMDLWAARLVHKIPCENLVDVGSRIDGFIAHILSFRDVEIFDVRPLESKVKGLSFRQMDLSQSNVTPLHYADCVTSLHALEHFGLGRYGDEINLDGWLVGLSNLVRLLKPNGNLILAVPIGVERIEFDAHRVFHASTIEREARKLGLNLESFSYVDDAKEFHQDVDIKQIPTSLLYGCGCYHFSYDNPLCISKL